MVKEVIRDSGTSCCRNRIDDGPLDITDLFPLLNIPGRADHFNNIPSFYDPPRLMISGTNFCHFISRLAFRFKTVVVPCIVSVVQLRAKSLDALDCDYTWLQ